MEISARALGAELGASLRSQCDLIDATLTFHTRFLDVGICAGPLGAHLGASLRSLCDLIDSTLTIHRLFHRVGKPVEQLPWGVPRGGMSTIPRGGIA